MQLKKELSSLEKKLNSTRNPFCPSSYQVKNKPKNYNSSFYGSNLWNLQGDKTKQVINSWSVAVRLMWDLPLNTHRRFIKPLVGPHAQAIIMSNYVRFIQSIRNCNKLAVIYLLDKVRSNLETMTGSNIRHILDQVEEDDIFKIKEFAHSMQKKIRMWVGGYTSPGGGGTAKMMEGTIQ